MEKLNDASQATQFVREMMKNCGTLSYNCLKIYQVCPWSCDCVCIWSCDCVACRVGFITELLKNAGTHIDPTKVIKVSSRPHHQ